MVTMASVLAKICRQRIIISIIILTLLIFVYLSSITVNHRRRLVSAMQVVHEETSHGERESYPDSNEDILEIAKRIGSSGKPVLITLINDAYLSFANSWLCNTIYMEIHQQVLLVTTDSISRDTLRQRWADIHVALLPGGNPLSGDQEFSHAGYVRIMIRRSQVILELLKSRLKVLLFEVDCVWFTNPIPECQRSIHGYDLLATMVSNRTHLVGGGFLYIKPTNAAVKLWARVTEKLTDLEDEISNLDESGALSPRDNDQVYLSNLIAAGYAGVQVVLMPLDRFADGRWYKLQPHLREQLHPAIINNNWVTGNRAKIRRARKFKHWFWKKSDKCDLKLVKRTVY